MATVVLPPPALRNLQENCQQTDMNGHGVYIVLVFFANPVMSKYLTDNSWERDSSKPANRVGRAEREHLTREKSERDRDKRPSSCRQSSLFSPPLPPDLPPCHHRRYYDFLPSFLRLVPACCAACLPARHLASVGVRGAVFMVPISTRFSSFHSAGSRSRSPVTWSAIRPPPFSFSVTLAAAAFFTLRVLPLGRISILLPRGGSAAGPL